MSSIWGDKLKISLFGESHGPAVGITLNGLPAGVKLDFDEIDAETARRRPGGALSTPRTETDEYRILSGVLDGVTTGAPLTAIISNDDVKSRSYLEISDIPRPGHSDYAAAVKYGRCNDVRGGGHFSARLTAPLVFAGALAKQILSRNGIKIAAHLYSVKDVFDKPFDSVNPDMKTYIDASRREVAALDLNAAKKMRDTIEAARAEGDSVGGIVECVIAGVPAGIGEPIFDGVENKIASIVFGIPAVKGIEFGAGFAATRLFGSQNNDAFYTDGDKIKSETNNAGGALGGIGNGMPILFRAAFKPTPSVAKPQKSVNLSTMQNVELSIKGRHDPCVALRAVPCVEAAAALAMLDLTL